MIDSKDYSRASANEEAKLYFNNSKRIWKAFFISLPIDFLILSDWFRFLRYGHWDDLAKPIALILLIISCVLVFRDRLLPLIVSAKRLRGYESSEASGLLAKVISFLLFGGMVVLINLAEESTFGSLLIPIILTGIAIYSIIKSLRDAKFGKTKEDNFSEDKPHQEFGSRLVFYLDLLAITATRCLSLSGALIACKAGYPLSTFIPYFLVAFLLMLELFPREELYLKVCQGCALQTSTVFMNAGFCFSCSQKRKRNTGVQYKKKEHFKKISELIEKLAKMRPDDNKEIVVKSTKLVPPPNEKP